MTKVPHILNRTNEFILNSERSQYYFTKSSSFTRKRSLDLENICHFMLSNGNRSLSIELSEYFSNKGQKSCTKSAFSRSRYQIKPQFFKDWYQHSVASIYEIEKNSGKECGLKTWKGFSLKGIDGSSLYLLKNELLQQEFGGQNNQFGAVAMARLGFCIDLLNGYCTNATILPYSQGEQVFAKIFLEESSEKDLLIYDRYYASYGLIYEHLEQKRDFVMRCKVGWTKEVKAFVLSKKKQLIIQIPISNEAHKSLLSQGYKVAKTDNVKVRLLRIDIGQQEPEILITSLLNTKKYLHKCFKELYNYRWVGPPMRL